MTKESKKNIEKIGLVSAIAFIVANMVGTGVFTSLGFQLAGGVTDVAALMVLWLIGGIIAFTGAMVYGELGSTMPRSGGEYHYLSRIYHPAVGFMSGLFSMIAGFAAPIALAAIALGKYMSGIVPWVDETLLAAAVIILITMVHLVSVRFGSRFQTFFTVLKILLIVVFIVCGFLIVDEPQPASLKAPSWDTFDQITSTGFAVSLIFVFYAFSGWNASAYFVNDLKNPTKNLPKSLLIGSLIVTVLYLLINYIFLRVAPIDSMTGQLEVGKIAANEIFGVKGGLIMCGVISLLLVSSISAMVFAGPRVIQVIGEDYPRLGFMSRKNSHGIPVTAIVVQTLISLVLLFTATFESLLNYLGLCMNIFCFLAVLGIFVHRRRFPDAHRPYKVWGYPVTPIVFMLFFIWNFYYMAVEKTTETVVGVLTLVAAFLVYLLVRGSRNSTYDPEGEETENLEDEADATTNN